MTNFLPNVFRLIQPGKILPFVFVLGSSVAAHAQADLQITDLTLTAGDERTFDYSFTITNAGTQAVTSYALQLTFSGDQSLDGLDYFHIDVPADAATQSLSAGQSASRSLHFEASAVNQYLPSGTWFVIVEINPDHAVTETNLGNNQVVSTNTITVDPYTAEFLSPPTVTNVTSQSFDLNYASDGKIYHTFYRYQFSGLPIPGVDEMRSSSSLIPDVPLTISYLGPAQAYDVYFMGEARDGNVTDIRKVEVTTSGAASPTVITSGNVLALYPVGMAEQSVSSLIDVYAFHLTAPVIVKASEGFSVSVDDTNYASEVSLNAAGFSNGVKRRLFVRAEGFDTPGPHSGTCLLATTGSSDQTVNVSVVVFNPFATDFNSLSTLEESGWTTYSVFGGQTWSLADLDESSVEQRTAGQNMAMQIDGAVGGPSINEDWLISPEVDLSTFTQTPALRFRAYRSGDGEPLTLMYSADYPGYGDPRYFTWFDTMVSLSNTAPGWQNAMLKLLSQEEHVHFALVYKSTLAAASKWTIDDWRIMDNPVYIPDNLLVFDNVTVGTASDPQMLLVSVAGYGTVTVTASDEFQVSIDGVVFSPAVVVPEGNITAGIQLNVRYTPKHFTTETTGSLTFTSASGFSVTRNTLVGHPGITTGVVEARRGSGFLYPNPTNGDVHVDLETLSGGDGSYPVLIANSIGGKVASFDASAYTLDHALTTIVTNLEPGVYFVVIKGASGTMRTKLIRK